MEIINNFDTAFLKQHGLSHSACVNGKLVNFYLFWNDEWTGEEAGIETDTPRGEMCQDLLFSLAVAQF